MNEHRPQRGLAPEAALKRWSDDTQLYAEMHELSDAWQPCSTASGYPPSPRVVRHREYAQRRKVLEEAFIKKLQDMVVVASARVVPGAARRPIDPDEWDELEVDYMLDEIVGIGIIYRNPEFFEPSAVPLNVRDIPDWLAAACRPAGAGELPALVNNEDYSRVKIGQIDFRFGMLQARIIQRLHAQRLKNDGWCLGKNLMADVGSKQAKISTLFKRQPHIDELIERDGRGYVRLRAR